MDRESQVTFNQSMELLAKLMGKRKLIQFEHFWCARVGFME